MYAIIEFGGHQWKVEPGTRFEVNQLPQKVGDQVPVDQVLFGYDGAKAHVGRPYVEGAQVICEVVEHRLSIKTISYHYRRRENWRKTIGHRQPLTRLVVKDILFAGAAPVKAAAPAIAKAEASTPRVAKAKPKAHKSSSSKPTSSRPKSTKK